MEHHRHQDGREQLEEALDPQVDHPEAPVVDHGEIRVRAEEERRQVEDGDRGGGVQEQRAQL